MKETICRWVIVMFGVAILTPMGAMAADRWPQFRGLTTGAVADDPALPDTWSETENVAWKIDVPGLSWSSPVVWDDHVFLTTAISEGEENAPIAGLYDPGDERGSSRSGTMHRWVVMNVDFGSG